MQMRKKHAFTMLATLTLTLTVLALWLPIPGNAEKVSNMKDLERMLTQSGLKIDNFNTVIQENHSRIEAFYLRQRREIRFESPMDFYAINPKYFTVSFDARIKPQGGRPAQEKPAVITYLFEKSVLGQIEFINYLPWVSDEEVKFYSQIDVDQLCQYFRDYRQVTDCFPTRQAVAVAEKKTDGKTPRKFFGISAEDITSGVIKESYIDPTLVRNADLTARLDAVAKRLDRTAEISGIADRVNRLENVTTDGLSKRIARLEESAARLETVVTQLNQLLEGVSRKGTDIVFSKVNLHVVNGSGSSEGSENGLGNLVLGYNQGRRKVDLTKTSHQAVVGKWVSSQGESPHLLRE
jgi:hypothetical protein